MISEIQYKRGLFQTSFWLLTSSASRPPQEHKTQFVAKKVGVVRFIPNEHSLDIEGMRFNDGEENVIK